MQLPIKLRSLRQSDIPYVFSSWLKTYLRSPAISLIKQEVYFVEHRRMLEGLKDVESIVCCNPADEDQIFGYLVGKHKNSCDILHWVYVKLPYQRFGIAKEMVQHFQKNDTLFCSHYTEDGKKLIEALSGSWSFNPYLIYGE